MMPLPVTGEAHGDDGRSLASRPGCVARSPFRNLFSSTSLPTALQRGDACLLDLQHVGSNHIAVEGPSLVLGDPVAHQVAADLVAFGKTVQVSPAKSPARRVLLTDADAQTLVVAHDREASRRTRGYGAQPADKWWLAVLKRRGSPAVCLSG